MKHKKHGISSRFLFPHKVISYTTTGQTHTHGKIGIADVMDQVISSLHQLKQFCHLIPHILFKKK